ncbi:MAG: hypothetical protein HQK54_15360 [Oligoflexales bacterium]|nr:hypothetical protein [Oligoflexales bacterium]
MQCFKDLFFAVLVGSLPVFGITGCASKTGNQVGVGAELLAADETGTIHRLRIDGIDVDPKNSKGELALFAVSYQDPSDSNWKNFCLPDPDGVSRAIPLPGFWDKSGNFNEKEGTITFACTSGVIAKCVRWGYIPWKNVQGKSLKDLHQACTRMARADYCGNGKSHTRDGTMIDVFDPLGIQKRTDDDKFFFEAAWSTDGATYVAKARWFETLEEIVKECPEKLKGHTALDNPPLSPEEIMNKWPKTLIFNSSHKREK